MSVVASATSPLQLRRAANQANFLFEQGIISDGQLQRILSEIEDRKFEFDDDDVLTEQRENEELSSVLDKAVSLGLTTDSATKRMLQHVDSGRFSPGHYIDLWTQRIANHTLEKTPVEPVVESKRKRIKRRQETVPTDASENEKVEEGTTTSESPDFDAMTKKELVDLLKERGLPVSGKKSELIERLMKWVEEG